MAGIVSRTSALALCMTPKTPLSNQECKQLFWPNQHTIKQL